MKCRELPLTALEDSGHPEHESAMAVTRLDPEMGPGTAAAAGAGSYFYPEKRRKAQINTYP